MSLNLVNTWKALQGNWNLAANWTLGSVPNGIGAIVAFNAPAMGTAGVDLAGGPFTIGTLYLDGTQNKGGFGFFGGQMIMQVASGQAAINVQTDDFNVDFGTYGPLTLQLNSDTTVTEAVGATLEFSSISVISGAGALTIAGDGATTLSGSDTYTGGTTISGGRVRIGNAAAFGAGAITFDGTIGVQSLVALYTCTLTNSILIDAGASVEIGAVSGVVLTVAPPKGFSAFSGSATPLHFGSAADQGVVDLDLTPPLGGNLTGAVSIDGGTVVVGDAAAANWFSFGDGGFTVGTGVANATLDMHNQGMFVTNFSGAWDGVVTNSGAGLVVFEVAMGVDGVYSGTISDGAGQVQLQIDASVGSLTLNGANTYSGSTSIDYADVVIGDMAALGTGVINFGGTTGVATLSTTVSGTLTNQISILAGVSVEIGARAGVALTLGSKNSGFDDLGGYGSTLHFGSATDTGVVNLAPFGASTAGGGAIAVDGGDLVLRNLYCPAIVDALTGGVTVGSGVATATLDLNGNNVQAYDFSGASDGVVTSNGGAGALTVIGDMDTTYAGTLIDGGGKLSLLTSLASHTLTLGGNNTYTGGTTLVGGTLLLETSNSAGSVAGAITFAAAGATLALAAGADPQNFLIGLNANDSLKLLGYDLATTESVSGHVLTVVDGAKVDTFELDPAAGLTTQQFSVVQSVAGGVTLSLRSAFKGGGQTFEFAGGAGTVISLSGSAGNLDTVTGSNGVINLTSDQANVFGVGDTIHFGAGAGSAANLIWSGAASYSVNGFVGGDIISLFGLTSDYAPATSGVAGPSSFALAIAGNVVTQTNADGSSLVSHFNVAGQTYSSVIRAYDKSGDLTAVEHEHVTGAPYIADTTLYSGPGTTGNIVSGNDLFYTGQASGLSEVDLDGSGNLLRALYAYPGANPGVQTGFDADYVAGEIAGGIATYLAPAGATYSTFAVEYDNNYQYVGAVYTFNYTGKTYDEAQYSYSAGALPKLTEATFSGYTGSGGPSVASFFYDNNGASVGVQYSYAGIAGQAYTSDTLLYNSSNVLIAAQYCGYTTKPFSAQTTFYDASGVAQEIVRDFTGPASAGAINGQAYNAYEKIFNPSFVWQATAYHLDNGGNVYVGAASNVTTPTFGGTSVSANTAELSNTLTGGDWTITGGGTGETFNFAAFFNKAEITDYGAAFNTAIDVISVSTQDFADWTTMLGDAAPSGGGANTTFTSTMTGDKLTLDGVTLSQLTALTTNQANADFLFHA